MSTFKNRLTPLENSRLLALDAWYKTLEDRQLRMDCPDSYHEELLRQADEMDRVGIVTWEEWRDLRLLADQAYLHTVAGKDYH
jgi:hypothetical protein